MPDFDDRFEVLTYDTFGGQFTDVRAFVEGEPGFIYSFDTVFGDKSMELALSSIGAVIGDSISWRDASAFGADGGLLGQRSAVPEPSTLAVLLAGSVVLLGRRRRRGV